MHASSDSKSLCRTCGMPLAYDRYMKGESGAAAESGQCTYCANPRADDITPPTSGDVEKMLGVLIRVYHAKRSPWRALARLLLAMGPVVPSVVQAPMKVINSVPRKDPSSKFDAVVLYSGGKDSSYMLLNLAKRNLRICAWMLQQGYQSPHAVANARRLCDKIGVPLHIEAPDKDLMDRVFRTGFDVDMNEKDSDVLRAAMTYGSACGACFTSIASYAAKFCIENNPAFCFIGTQEGQNRMDLSGKPILATESLPTVDIMLTRAFFALRRRIAERVPGALPDITPGACRTVLVPFYEFVRKPPLEQQLAVLTQAGWEMPNNTGTCSTNCMVNELGRHVMRHRFGFDLYQIMDANERRLGKCRGERVDDAHDEDRVDASQVARAAKIMGLSNEEKRRYGVEP